MSFELIFTSAERGLKPGTRGFTTVAMTQGMPVHCVQLCESLSGYVHAFDLNPPTYDRNPVSWSHYRMKCGGRQYSVLSRVASHPKDYTGRTNKIAHHMMLEVPEETALLVPGPAALLAHPGLFQQKWAGDPRYLPVRNRFQMREEERSFKADMWARHGLKPEWAAVVARAVWQDPVIPVFIIFDPAQGHNPQALVGDALRLLPPSRRWNVTFCSYLTALPAGAECHIRGCLDGSDAAFRAARMPNAVVFDLSKATRSGTDALPAGDQRLGIAATSGKLPLWKEKADAPVDTSPKPGPQEPTARAAAVSSPSPKANGRPGRASQRIVAPPVGVGGRSMGTPGASPKRQAFVAVIVLLAILVVVVVWQEIRASRGRPSDPQQSQPEGTPDVTPLASPKRVQATAPGPAASKLPNSAPAPDSPDKGTAKASASEGESKGDASRKTVEKEARKHPDAADIKPKVHVYLASDGGIHTEPGDRYWLFRHDGTRQDLKNFGTTLKPEQGPGGKYGNAVGMIEKDRLKFQFSPATPILAIARQDGRILAYYVQTNCYPVITAQWARADSYGFNLGGLAAFITNIPVKPTVHLTIGDDRREVMPAPINGARVELGKAVNEQIEHLSRDLDRKAEAKLKPYRELHAVISGSLPTYKKLDNKNRLEDEDRQKKSQLEQALKTAVQQACQMEDVFRGFLDKANTLCSGVLSGIDKRISDANDDAARARKSDLIAIQRAKDSKAHISSIQPNIVRLFDYDFDLHLVEWSKATEAGLKDCIGSIEDAGKRGRPGRMPVDVTISLPDVGPIAVYRLPK
jgi:hypothetical protein